MRPRRFVCPGAPVGAGLCIWRPGDALSCPAPYPVHHEVFDVKGLAQCGDCTCTPSDAPCTVSVEVFPEPQCGGDPTMIGDPECFSGEALDGPSAQATTMLPEVPCVYPLGQDAPTSLPQQVGFHTVCCRQPGGG